VWEGIKRAEIKNDGLYMERVRLYEISPFYYYYYYHYYHYHLALFDGDRLIKL